MMKKLLFVLLSLILYSQTTLAADKLVVLLDWFANPSHAPLFVAEQQGYFKEQNLDVELIGPADPADPPKLVAAKKAEIAITYEPQLIEQVDRGLPLVSIGALIDKSLNCLVVLKDSPIHTIKDLKGKSVGYSSGDVTSVSLKTMLKKNKLTLNDIKEVNVRYDLTQALLTKHVDAVIGMMRTFEVIQLELAGHPARVFLPEENGVPNHSELIFVVHKDQKKDARFKRFLIAVRKGRNYLIKHPEQTWQVFAKTHPELNNELNHRAWMASLKYFAKNPAHFDLHAWEKFILFMQKNGLIKHAQPVEQYVAQIALT